MDKWLLIFIIDFFISILSFGQVRLKCSIPIEIPEYQIYINPFHINHYPDADTTINIRGNRKIKLRIFNCQGDMFLEEMDSSGNLIIAGSFCKSLDTLSDYVTQIDPSEPYYREVAIQKYFIPLKSGIWLYYNNNQIIKKEVWYRGVQQFDIK
jgi:hypothetical protein